MRRLIAALLVVLGAASPLAAQQLRPPSTGGIAALDARLGRLATNKRVLYIAAHPDDEDTEFLTLLSRGLGVDAAYLALSRGEGGQNLIGNELGEALGLIRTGELLAARSQDGAHQYFTRAFDFGFSKSLAEADRFWPRDSMLADVVRVIRRFRPQVIVAAFSGTPRDGHGQHQQSGVLAQQAFELLKDSAWGPKKFYRSSRFDTTGTTLHIPSGMLDPASGRSILQIAMAGRSLHRSQDMGQLQRLGSTVIRLRLAGTAGPMPAHDDGLFAGVDTTLAPGLARYGTLVDSARAVLGPHTMPEVTHLLLAALGELRRHGPADYRARKEASLQEAIADAAGIVVDAASDDDRVTPGEPFTVAISVWNAGTTTAGITGETLAMPAGWTSAPLPPPTGRGEDDFTRAFFSTAGVDTHRFRVTVAPDAPLTEPYFLVRPKVGDLYDWSTAPDSLKGEALDPPLVTARVRFDLAGTEVEVTREVSSRTVDQASGEIRRPIYVVPAVGVSVDPDLLVWPVQADGTRRVTVELTHGAREATSGELRLEVPGAWPEVPPQRFALTGEDTRSSYTFTVQAPPALTPGDYEIHAVATADGRRYDRGTVLVDYPHIRPIQYTKSATVHVEAASLALPNLRAVGYIRGAADVVPEDLQSIGVPVTVLSAADLERGDLSRFDVIVVGSRAYEVDPALVANNERLLDYARAGGRVIVQYQQYAFIRGGFAPYPLTIANPHDRVTDENAPVRILAPGSPLFTTPNRIGPDDWQGWIQERGLYFAHTWDGHYRPMLEMGDPPISAQAATGVSRELAVRRVPPSGTPGADATTEQREALHGGLLVARLGQGLYVYTGLAFFRELPAGVPGAYRLFVNLLGLEPNNVP